MAVLPLTVEAQKPAADWSAISDSQLGVGTTYFNASRQPVQTTPYLSPRAKLFLATGQYDRMQAVRMNDWATTAGGAENAVVLVWKTADEATCYADRQAELVSGFLGDMIDDDHDGETDDATVKLIFMGLHTPKQQNIIVLGCTNPGVESMNHVANQFFTDPEDQALTLKFYDGQMWNSGTASASPDELSNMKQHAFRATFLAMYDMAWRHAIVELSRVNVAACLTGALGKLYVRDGSVACYTTGNGAADFAEPAACGQYAVGDCDAKVGTTVTRAVTASGDGTIAAGTVNQRTCSAYLTSKLNDGTAGKCWGRTDEVFGDSASMRFSTWNEDEEVAELVYSLFSMIRGLSSSTAGAYALIPTRNFQSNVSADSTGAGNVGALKGTTLERLEDSLSQTPTTAGGTLLTAPTIVPAQCTAIHTAIKTTYASKMGQFDDNYTATDSDDNVSAVIPVFAPAQAFPTVDYECPAAEPVHVTFDQVQGEQVTCTVVQPTTPANTTTTNTSNSAGRALTSVGAAVLGVAALAGAALF